MMKQPLLIRSWAEFVGTFVLVFAGCGAIIINSLTAGEITHTGIGLVFGLVITAMIYALGDVSGAHFNPAVTLGFTVAGRFSIRDLPAYFAAQCSGAIAAAGVLRCLFPDGQAVAYGATIPRPGYVTASWVLEALLTWVLMLVILRVSTGAKEKGITAGIAIGAVIGLEAIFAGPICGASMNPARSLGPALMAGEFASLPLYWLSPMVGALLAIPTFRFTEIGNSQ